MSKNQKLTATKFRALLIVCIFIIIGLSIVGFYFAQSWLSKYAITVGQAITESTDSSNSNGANVAAAKRNQEQITNASAEIAKADLFSVSTSTYRDQTLKDINAYVAKTGLNMTSYTFDETASANTTATNSGLNSSSIKIELKNPVKFTDFIKFLKLIENNLPKMQVSGISITNNSSTPGTVNVEPLTIKVYTK